MELAEAKRIIGAYLTGQPVAHSILAAACATANSDAEYLRFLTEELGLRQDWNNECASFLAEAAEFCAMTPAERVRERPEALAHLGGCATCKAVFWSINPLWRTETVPQLAGTSSFVRRLAERLRLNVAAGRVRESGLGPPPRAMLPVAAIAGSEQEPWWPGASDSGIASHRRTAIKEWTLPDEESDCALTLRVSADVSGQLAVNCALESADARLGERARIEVRDATSQTLFLSGRLANFETEPIFLAPGKWTISVQGEAQSGTHMWEIPLEIEQETGTDEESYVESE